MNRILAGVRRYGADAIWWIGCVMTLAVTVMRVSTAPLSRNHNTGHFTVNMVVIFAALAAVAVMAAVARLSENRRVDIADGYASPLMAAAMAAGALIGIGGLYDLLAWFLLGVVPPPYTAMTSAVPMALMIVTALLAVAAGVTLIVFGRRVKIAHGTEAGMGTWEMLIPVLWTWFRLTRYLMSYASAVSLDECIYDFGMLVSEMLFVFRLARFVSGIGRTAVGGLLAYAMSVAVWTLSAVLTRMCMYLLGDTQAYLASELVSVSDAAIGVFALMFAGVLWRSAHYSSCDAVPSDSDTMLE